MHFIGWPDHGTPKNSKPDFETVLNVFIDKLISIKSQQVI
jgi:hypothetical protein